MGWPDGRRSGLRRVAVVVLVAVASGLVLGSPAGAQDVGDPQGPVAPAEVRDQVRDVMSRPEFDYSPSWFQRVLDWIGEQLAKIFQPGDDVGAGGSFAGGIGALIGWLLIVAAIAAIVVVVVWLVTNRTRRAKADRDEPLTPVEVEHRRRAEEWLADAERLEGQGDWKGALRARYRNLVRILVDRRQVPDVAGRTTGELRTDLDRTTPSVHEQFDTCSLLFELAWYAGVPTGAEESGRFRTAADEVLAATVVERFDPASTFDPDAGAVLVGAGHRGPDEDAGSDAAGDRT